MSLPGRWYVNRDSLVQEVRLVADGETLAFVYRTEEQWRWTWIDRLFGEGGGAESRAEAMVAVRGVQRRLGKEARDAK